MACGEERLVSNFTTIIAFPTLIFSIFMFKFKTTIRLLLEEENFTGSISSPNYPKPYPEASYCVWTLRAPRTHAVQLSFDAFTLPSPPQGASECQSDYLEIFDDDLNRQMAKLCGQKIPPTQKTVGEVMSLKLVADQSAGGFSATYSLKTCGGIFTGRSGTVNNELKNQYHKGRDLKWRQETMQH